MNVRGLSLLELLLYLAALGLVSLAVLQIFSSTLQTYTVVQKRVEVQQDTRATLEWIMRIVRNASVVVRAESHSITVMDPGGMIVTYASPMATFLYHNGVTPSVFPESIRSVTVTIGGFSSTAALRNDRGTDGEAGPSQCATGAYVPNGWNVFC
jgi:type II secretory pathway component PulJ